MTPILLILAIFVQIHGNKGQVVPSVNPIPKVYCEKDAFIASQPLNGKVYLTPYTKADRQADWYEARGYCAANCAQMVTIHSAAENDFFVAFMSSTGMTGATWVGAQIVDRTVFTNWSNGEVSDYQNRAGGEYDDAGLNCVNINANKLWYSYPCSYAAYFVACQRYTNYTMCE